MCSISAWMANVEDMVHNSDEKLFTELVDRRGLDYGVCPFLILVNIGAEGPPRYWG
jgi:hypothetical protein